MPDIDLFRFFRYMLGWTVTIYATIITAQSLWGWYVYLISADRYTALLRRYVIVQALRLRFKAFWGDLILCILLTIAFFLLWHAQGILDHIEDTMKAINPVRTITHA
jgi:hypothetical protein